MSPRYTLWKRQNGQCHYCRRIMTMLSEHPTLTCTADHLVPRSQGGADHLDNYVGACIQCNGARGTMPAELFERYVRRFGPPMPSRIATSNRALRKAAGHMIANEMPAEIINDVLRQKLEAAIRAKIAVLDAAPIPSGR